ncbi:hypothetical protein [Pedobacter sp. MW01-1-1]|uniref:hypothetical protein n=1 Tax=Pedobacter sp. MW01-1-1 TaxID=3383027 RepID=UPI003FF11F5A
MKKVLLSLIIFLCSINLFAQTAADYDYSIGVRAYSMMQLPKILNQTNDITLVNVPFNGAFVKLNTNQTSFRISGSYYKGDQKFDNTCSTCDIISGKTTDYSFKLGFEKNVSYTAIQPYYGFDIGFRANKFDGLSNSKTARATTPQKNVVSTKNGLILSPLLGIKVNIFQRFCILAESSFDMFYNYEKQDVTEDLGVGRTVTTYKKWDFLINPVSVGIQYSLSSKN